MNHIEIGTPAVLPLAFAKMDVDGVAKTVMLGMTLQHPPIHYIVAPHQELTVYGPRAHVARRFARAYMASSGATVSAEIKIENTSPAHVGFASDALIALSTAQAVAWVNEDQDHEDIPTLAKHVGLTEDDALAYWSYQQGGVLLVEMTSADGDMPKLLRHFSLEHRSHLAWAISFHFPPHPNDAPDSFEQDRYAIVKAAAENMPSESGKIIHDILWPALEGNDIDTFGAALATLREMNLKVLAEADGWQMPNAHAEKVMRVMRENGALAVGENYTGITVFGLVHGSLLSQQIRTEVMKQIGYFKGQFEHTINDVDGSKLTVKDESMHEGDYRLPNTASRITGPNRRTHY